jgi:outer membrane autotransporter protein
MAQNSHLQFNIAEGKKIIMDGGIKSDIGNTIKKTGTGDLILDGITDFKGELNLESGQIISLAPVINISSFIMSSQAKFSLKNAAVSGLNIDSGVINGIIELDLDFNASTGDFIYASNSLEIISSSSITISLLALGKQGNEIEIIRAGNLIYTDGSFFGYDPSIYNIYKEGNSIIAKLIRNPNPISYLGNLNSNQNSVFNLLNASINIPLSDLRYQVATLENGKAKKALSKLSGSFLINAAITGGKTENIDSVFNRISYNAPAVLSDEENSDEENSDKNIPVWLQLNFNNENFESVDSPLGKIDYSRAGFLAGAELLKNAGLFIGYASKTIKQDSDKADISDIELGVYNSMQLREQINVKLALSASLQNIASDRSIDFANLNPQADFDSKSIKFGASAQWTISDLLKPFISVQGALVMLNDIEEKNGGAANLIINSDNYTRLSTLSGLKIEKQGDINIYAKSYLSYLMLGADPQYEISFTIEEAPQSMKIKAEKEPQLLFGLGAGINYKASETINAFADIAIELAPDLTGYKANIGAKVKF